MGQTCDRDYGPAGNTECVDLSPDYFGKQWATCLSNAYIQEKSEGRHICEDETSGYCWYQCMIEIYDEEDGLVYGSCSCGDGYTTPRPVTGGSSLPATCYSPAGDDCDWYRQCLEQRYPCGDTETGYAIPYAEKFCHLYNDRLSYFSEDGQLWVNAVRKCLQVTLVPLMRPYENPTCQDIKQTAFDSHSGCYLAPHGGPSFCDLNCVDWAQAFWTIKGAFQDEFVESMKGMVEVVGRCAVTVNLFDENCPSVVVWTIIQIAPLLRRGKRQLDQQDNDARATAIANAIAQKQGWDADGLGWYAYGDSSNSTHLTMTLLLGDRRALGEARQESSLPFSQTDALTDLVDAIESGQLGDLSTTDGGYAHMREMRACTDIDCTQAYLSAVSPSQGVRAGGKPDQAATVVIAAVVMMLLRCA